MAANDISVKTSDFDTLGGRLGRALDAKDLSSDQAAELVGVEGVTFKTWECDQALPRSNKLAMLAGVLGVSPSWLLFGRGASPQQETSSDDRESLELQLDVLKAEYQKIGTAIATIEASLQDTSSNTSE